MTIRPVRVLITGFGGFPGASNNPTALMIAALAKYRSRFIRAGIRLELVTLPVVYAKIAPCLSLLAQQIEPDAILHFGLAARRKTLCIETRALNRLSLLHYDADGARAERQSIVPGASLIKKSTLPCALMAATLRRAGVRADLSIDAGDYVCNQTLFFSLNQNHAALVGFIHVPRLGARHNLRLHRPSLAPRPRMTLEGATRAAVIAILALASKLPRRDVRPAPGADAMKQAPSMALDPLPLRA